MQGWLPVKPNWICMRKILIALLMIVSSNVYAINNCNPYVKYQHYKEVLQCTIISFEEIKLSEVDHLNKPLTAFQQRFSAMYDLFNSFTKLRIQLINNSIIHRKQLIEAIDAKQINDKNAMDIHARTYDDEAIEMSR